MSLRFRNLPPTPVAVTIVPVDDDDDDEPDDVEADDDDDTGDIAAEADDDDDGGDGADIVVGFGRFDNDPFVSDIILLAAVISALSSTRTVHGFVF